MKKLFFAVLLMAFSLISPAQSAKDRGYSAITHSSIQGQLEFLASDWMEGRQAGAKGAFIASDYIASMFKVFGIAPYGDYETIMPSREEMRQGRRPERVRSYFQNMALMEYAQGATQEMSIVSHVASGSSRTNFTHQVDFQVQTATVGTAGTAPLFFAGYGISDKDFDEYKSKDIKGKIVVILAGFPGHRDSTSAAFKKFSPLFPLSGRFSSERNKITKAEELGALAVVLVNSTANPALSWAANSPYPVKGAYYEADHRLSSYYDKRLTLPGDTLRGSIPVFTVTNRVANLIFDGSGIDTEAYENSVKQRYVPGSRDLAGKELNWTTTVESKILKCRNVLGWIEGKNRDEFIVVGAHYDHLGKHDGWIFNGADDNGSGTVGVMEMAKAFAVSGEKPEKSIIFAAWTAEEMGLHGSRYFVQTFPKSLKIAYNLNFDMLSRNVPNDTKGNMMDMMYMTANPKLKELTEKNIRDYQINLDVNYRASAVMSGGSDHAPFANVGIPATFFFAAMHPDYHLPSDELSKLNWEKMLNMIRLGYLNVWDIINNNSWLDRSN